MEKDAAIYFAGIIDGEGTISAVAGDGKPGHGRPYIQVANSNFKLADWIEKNVPGKYGFYKYHRNPEKQKPTFLCQWRGPEAIELVRHIEPYLILKREQARLILELWEGEGKWNQIKRGRWCKANPMPQELLDFRVDKFNKLRELNRKGPIEAAV